jgi:methylase of polypeptide subunit release factors
MATAHVQQQILTALAATLVAASTAAGASVYVDHPDELTAAMLPAIVITAGPEQIEAMGMGFPFAQDRRMAVDIISVCTGSGAAAASRALAGQVEAAIYASETTARLGGLAKSPLLLQSADPTITGQASQLIAEVRQGWQVLYQTASGAPTVAT